MKLPNFFLVGAAKAGTTAVHVYLYQHPEVFMSFLKEPKYLSISANKFPHNGPGDEKVDDGIIKSREEYLDLFKDAGDEKVIGESSADYLYFHDTVIPLIKTICPSAKILIMLRNPVDRAYSAYRHMIMDEREDLSFEKALKQEAKRRQENYEFIWFYKDVGFYYEQVKHYIESFGREYVMVCLYDDFVADSAAVMKDIYRFLDVDEGFAPNTGVKYNVGPTVRSEYFEEFLVKYEHPVKRVLRPILLNTIGKGYTEALVNYFIRRNTLSMKPRTRKRLIELYRDDILKLEGLIDRNLSGWIV
ncbi:MAG: sulfotransferase [Thermodesulfobacteriota bacterium]